MLKKEKQTNGRSLKMQLKTNKKQNGGITLIALVVTIVVLLILAGITITMVLGEDGILSQAKLAAEKTKEAEEQQEKDLQDLAGMINEAVNGKDPGTLQDAVSSKKVFSHTTGYDSAGNKIDENSEEKKTATITIPAGFKIIKGDPSKINEGVVISDEAGNEFVWVPFTEEQYKKHTYTELKSEETDEVVVLVDGEAHDKGWNTWLYRTYKDWSDDGGNLESVKKYGGFYIARYEAGIPSSMTWIYVDPKSANRPYVVEGRNTSNYAPVSKKGSQAWNYISQANAKEAARKMYNGSVAVTSQLIDGIAWDRTVDWIVETGNYTDIEKDSTNYGNYANNGNDIGDKTSGLSKIKYNNMIRSDRIILENIINELESIKDSQVKIDYLYYEWFDSSNGVNKYETLIKDLKKEFTKKHLEFLELLHLLTIKK